MLHLSITAAQMPSDSPPPTIAIVAPKHHSFPNRHLSTILKLVSKPQKCTHKHEIKPPLWSIFIRFASFPECLVNYPLCPSQMSWAVDAMVETVIGVSGGRGGDRQS